VCRNCLFLRCRPFLDRYCSTVQGLLDLDWFEVDLGFTRLLFIQIDVCVMCVATASFYVVDRARKSGSKGKEKRIRCAQCNQNKSVLIFCFKVLTRMWRVAFRRSHLPCSAVSRFRRRSWRVTFRRSRLPCSASSPARWARPQRIFRVAGGGRRRPR